MSAASKIIVALDVPSGEKALELAKQVDPAWVKVGLELFCSEGPALVEKLAQNYSVMLDLKLHDIPATVASAVKQVDRLGAKMLTIHCSGGEEMMQAAASSTSSMDILGVTVLTSMDEADLSAVGDGGYPQTLVKKRAKLALQHLAGVVCSPLEAALVRQLSSETLIVTPGVRPNATATDDQKRVATPASAIANGASYLVIGRAIRNASDPSKAFRRIVEQLGG